MYTGRLKGIRMNSLHYTYPDKKSTITDSEGNEKLPAIPKKLNRRTDETVCEVGITGTVGSKESVSSVVLCR
jgi:hypothetical protein